MQHNTDKHAMSTTMMNDSDEVSNNDSDDHGHCDSCTASDTLGTKILTRLEWFKSGLSWYQWWDTHEPDSTENNIKHSLWS